MSLQVLPCAQGCGRVSFPNLEGRSPSLCYRALLDPACLSPPGDPHGSRRTQGAGAWAEPGGTLLGGGRTPEGNREWQQHTLHPCVSVCLSLFFSLNNQVRAVGTEGASGWFYLLRSHLRGKTGPSNPGDQQLGTEERGSPPHLAGTCPGELAMTGRWGPPGWGWGLDSRVRFRLQTRFSACSWTELRVTKAEEVGHVTFTGRVLSPHRVGCRAGNPAFQTPARNLIVENPSHSIIL